MPEPTISPSPEPAAGVATAAGLRCIDCGYDLQATPTDGACPECGLAVATTLNKFGTATLRGCFIAVCRLFAAWLVVSSIQYVVSMVWMLVYWEQSRGRAPRSAGVFEILSPILLPPVLNAVGFVVVWCLAPWAARMAVRRNRPLALGAGMRALDLYYVGLCLIGVWLCVNAMLDFIYLLAQGFEESRQFAADQFGTEISTQGLVIFIASIVAGVLLVHYGRQRLTAWPGSSESVSADINKEGPDG